MMTNPDGPKRESLQSIPEGATGPANSFTINIGRAMAKVSLAYIPDSDGEPNGYLDNIKYKVVNNPNQMYVMPWLVSGNIMTPHFNETQYNPEKFSGESADDYLDAILVGTPKQDMTATYCMENNNLMELKGNSTMVKVQAQYVPKVVLDDNDQPTTPNVDGTFWRIANVENDDITSFKDGYYAAQPTSLIRAGQKAVEFKEGICYYPIWLKTPAGNYMVKRNTYFKVVINSVTGAGWPDENGGINPVDPIEEYTTIRAGIRMVEWESVNQVVDL